jgi:N6-L-threonylcarbamoyladenine synthase
MNILAIETSCDETGAAVIKDGKVILSNVVASSQKMHVKSGGIIPEKAAREQIKSIMPVIDEALTESKLEIADIDRIAVTVGPGLIGSLLVGVETAKALSYLWNKPIIPVNHLMGHVYSAWLSGTEPEFPLIALVVSGGHTDLIYMTDHKKIKYLSGTRDDAAGEAFDKIARLLALGYPGGPAIAASATKYQNTNHKNQKLNLFPRPMIDSADYDFSFSGLKTAVLNYLKKNKAYNKNLLAAEVQAAIVDVLVSKTIKAVDQYKPNSLVVGGGVAANQFLRDSFTNKILSLAKKPSLHVAVAKYCGDNAAMIGAAAFYQNKNISWEKITANPELTITD